MGKLAYDRQSHDREVQARPQGLYRRFPCGVNAVASVLPPQTWQKCGPWCTHLQAGRSHFSMCISFFYPLAVQTCEVQKKVVWALLEVQRLQHQGWNEMLLLASLDGVVPVVAA